MTVFRIQPRLLIIRRLPLCLALLLVGMISGTPVSSILSGRQPISGPFTEDFRVWLDKSGYADYNFPALHLGKNASYGGRHAPTDNLNRTPVIFIHGNSDGALSAGTEWSSGWSASIEYFIESGYTPAELYAMTWGDRNMEKSFSRMHTCATLIRIRRFIEAVLNYTGAKKVDVIAHSMGVTLVRQVIAGGEVTDHVETCYLGKSIADKMHTLIGIAGANFGLCSCTGPAAMAFRACGPITGFFAGDVCHPPTKQIVPPSMIPSCKDSKPVHKCAPEYATNLRHLNTNRPTKEADRVFSFWSEEDNILGPNSVWGRKTSHIPDSDDFRIFEGMTHYQLKSDTVKTQYDAITSETPSIPN